MVLIAIQLYVIYNSLYIISCSILFNTSCLYIYIYIYIYNVSLHKIHNYEDMHNPWLYCFTNALEIEGCAYLHSQDVSPRGFSRDH